VDAVWILSITINDYHTKMFTKGKTNAPSLFSFSVINFECVIFKKKTMAGLNSKIIDFSRELEKKGDELKSMVRGLERLADEVKELEKEKKE